MKQAPALVRIQGKISELPSDTRLVAISNFSIKAIRNSKIVEIPLDQQMIVKQSITIEGSLETSGELVII